MKTLKWYTEESKCIIILNNDNLVLLISTAKLTIPVKDKGESSKEF